MAKLNFKFLVVAVLALANIGHAQETYAILNKKLDAGYYNTVSPNGYPEFYFCFQEEYHSLTNPNLKFEIFDNAGSLVSISGLVELIGDNRFSLNLSGLPSQRFYRINVYNKKNEVWKARIKVN